MKLRFDGNCLIVTREEGDPKYYGVRNAAGESRLLYAIKKQLNTGEWDLIKKRMHKDGHLVSEMQQYLRSRKPSGNPNKDIAIYNAFWQIEGIEVRFNAGEVCLEVIRDIFESNKHTSK